MFVPRSWTTMDPDSTQAKMVTEIERGLRAATPRRCTKPRLPDEGKCAGRQIARSDMVVCMAGADYQCEFSVDLHCGLFCFHPRRLEIAARTSAQPRAKTHPRAS